MGFGLWVAGCSLLDTRQAFDLKTYLRHDMQISVNGQWAQGVMVAQQASAYRIEIKSAGRLDMLKIISCHRELAIPNANPGGLFNSGRDYSFLYEPMEGIERDRPCPLRIEGYERNGGEHSFALIDFEETRHTMPARLDCNGQRSLTLGVSLCQSRKGLKQVLFFTNPMRHKVVGMPFGHAQMGLHCTVEVSEDKRTFTFYQPAKECYFAFYEESAPHRTHRHTAIGYEDIFVRGEP